MSLTKEQVNESSGVLNRIMDNIETVIIGKREAVELVVLAMVSNGHVLVEDVPGVGKTSLISALAKSIDCGFSRIQFTPDIMPSDVTGFSIFNQKDREFEFRPGAVMSNVILADEINRASAKTQSALLEVMEERQVTVDGNTYPMQEPFMVLATQNPLESYGTYPLPEAQIDRFLIKISIGYPSFEQEAKVVKIGKSAKKAIQPVVKGQDILLSKIAECLVNGGMFILVDLIPNMKILANNADFNAHSIKYEHGAPAMYKTCAEMVDLIESSPFELVELKKLGISKDYNHYLFALRKGK